MTRSLSIGTLSTMQDETTTPTGANMEQAISRHRAIRPVRHHGGIGLVLARKLDGFEAGTLVGWAATRDEAEALRRELATGIAAIPDAVKVGA